MPDFKYRSCEAEIMDDLQCSGEVVNRTLTEIEFINHWLGGNHVTLKGIEMLIKPHRCDIAIHLVDLGCGSGGMLKRIRDWGRKNKTPLRLTGIDANPNIIAFATRHAGNDADINFETANVLSPGFLTRKFDVVVATLFAHHFSDEDLIQMLTALRNQTQIGIVINDIHRHWLAFHSIRLLTRLFSRSSMVKYDAPLSVLRAFRRSDLEALMTRSGIAHYTLRWCWAFRWQLIIRTGAQTGAI